MPFAPGDRVHLPGLGTGVVLDSRGAHRYAVEIKGKVIVADEADLEHADAGSRPRNATPHERDEGVTDAVARRAPSVDLHGKTTSEAVAQVEAFINDALLAGHAEVHIIHGRGSGRVQAAVHGYLKKLSGVASFRLDPRNPGVTIVHFA